MPVEIKRVAYTYNSLLEDTGSDAYFLDCFVSRDGETLVNRHESFKLREEFMSAIQEIVPMLEPREYTGDDWDTDQFQARMEDE